MRVHSLEITNFKSIDTLTMTNLSNFSVFAGANGSGKTNIFQALEFVSSICRQGVSQTLREFGGYHNVHTHKRRSENASVFTFDIKLELNGQPVSYSLSAQLSPSTQIQNETVTLEDKTVLSRTLEKVTLFSSDDSQGKELPAFDPDKTALMFLTLTERSALYRLLQNIKVLRVDPIKAKQPSPSDHDPDELNEHASNLAAVLSRIQAKNSVLTEEILELITLIVPNLEKINTQAQKIDNETGILFKEKGTKEQFPAYLVSDGTIYSLAQIVMILDRHPNSWLLIEEPERGIHPQAIQELISLMRDESENTLIWINTHSESVIRTCLPKELLLVDKIDGKTQITRAHTLHSNLSLSDAWLSNMFKGGLPW